MNIIDIIDKKRLGKTLTNEEISYFVSGYTKAQIPDYQAAALLMAICINGMNDDETFHMTQHMMNSGEILSFENKRSICDKHSTGGVGDKTTLILAPMLAACGLKVAKMSGRGLGFTGGTIDKLESIKGFKTALDKKTFMDTVESVGLCVASQTEDIAPADKKMYALRDVTATVESIPLIAASILSKKLALGADTIVIDVKCGSGAFMKTIDNARLLANTIIKTGNRMGRKICAVISDMNAPLGYAVGNALEVNEAVQTLRGKGPDDIIKLCTTLGAALMCEMNNTENFDHAQKTLEESLKNNSAYEKFIEFVKAQGGDTSIFDDNKLIEINSTCYDVISDKSGYVQRINCEQIGSASLAAGAGRSVITDNIDHSAGIVVTKKIGDYVKSGELLAQIYSNSEQNALEARKKVSLAYDISEKKAPRQQLIYEIIN